MAPYDQNPRGHAESISAIVEKTPYIFFDRDGTIIVEKHYLHEPSEVEFCPGAVEGMLMLKEMGFHFAVVTNQSGIGRGYYQARDMQATHDHIEEELKIHDVMIDGWYHCPHAPDENCMCRKPNPGMFEQASEHLRIDVGQSYVIGDKACDIDFGIKCGMATVLVMTGHGECYDFNESSKPDVCVRNILEFANTLCHEKL